MENKIRNGWNKKGASLFVIMMFGILLFFFAFALASPLNNAIQSVRTNMGCLTNFSTMSYSSQVVCILEDTYSPFFIALIIGIATVMVGVIINL